MFFNPKFSLTSTALLTLALLGGARAQDAKPTDPHAGWFPFVIPSIADAQTTGSAIDLSFLSPRPAGSDGFLRAQGEKIVDGRGREIKFFGTNITDYHVMPPKDKALPIARRLRELGVNFVRLHYYDWAAAPEGLMNADMQTLNPAKLDQMDWLIFQLKQHGVYVDINLHVARHYPNLPAGWNWMGKGIDRVHPNFVASQKQFARDLLTHVNPYTKTTYTNEPAIAVVELNNENTVLDAGNDSSYLQLSALPDDLRAPIKTLWNSWLRAKYGTTQKLRAAWNGVGAQGETELVRNGELGANTESFGLENGAGQLAVVREGDRSFLRWSESKAGSNPWSLQLHQNEVPVVDGQQLRLRFRARADKDRTVQVRLMQIGGGWKNVAFGGPLALTNEWKTFDVDSIAVNKEGLPVRLSFDSFNVPGTIEIDDISLREGRVPGLSQDIELGDVALPSGESGAVVREDGAAWAAARERETTAEMMRFLRDDLKTKALLWDTQVNYGGTRGLLRESASSDAIDIHEYPSHPSGTRDENGKWTWNIERKSMIGAAFTTLPALGQWRVAGKPFFVSEFDLNPPNDFASETYPLLSAMAALQGWSGFAEYAWFNFQGADFSYAAERMHSPFATSGHAGQMAFMPASSLLLRQGLLAPAQTRSTLRIGKDALDNSAIGWQAIADSWKGAGIEREEGWRRALALDIVPTGAPALASAAPNAGATALAGAGPIRFNREKAGAETMTVSAPSLVMAMGHTGGQSFDLGATKIAVEPGTLDNYANIMVVAMDGLPFAQSRKVLVTAVARVENEGMKYNAERTSVGKDWGAGPTLAEPVKFSVSVPGTGWRASALDGKGRKASALGMSGATLRVSQPSSLWYLLER